MNKFFRKSMIILVIAALCGGLMAGCNTKKTEDANESKNTEVSESQETSTEEGVDETTIKSTKTNKATNSTATETKAIEKAIFAKVNAERKKAGKPAFKWDDTLYKATAVRAREVTSKFSHTRPNNTSCFTAITQSGVSYKSAAENIATGQTTADQVMKSWMNSSGHKKNILSNNKNFACAVIANPGSSKYRGYSFVQLFCTRR